MAHALSHHIPALLLPFTAGQQQRQHLLTEPFLLHAHLVWCNSAMHCNNWSDCKCKAAEIDM